MDFVCDNCFSDRELKAFIYSGGSVGDCCDSKESNIIRLEELFDFFEALLNNFERADRGSSLLKLLQEEWNFFSNNTIGNTIINSVLGKINTKIKSPNDKIVYADDITENISYWDELKNQLKWERRYLTDINLLTEDYGWDVFLAAKSQLKKMMFFIEREYTKHQAYRLIKLKICFRPLESIFLLEELIQ